MLVLSPGRVSAGAVLVLVLESDDVRPFDFEYRFAEHEHGYEGKDEDRLSLSRRNHIPPLSFGSLVERLLASLKQFGIKILLEPSLVKTGFFPTVDIQLNFDHPRGDHLIEMHPGEFYGELMQSGVVAD